MASRDYHTWTASSWAPLTPEQHGHTETSPEKLHKNYQRAWSTSAKRTGWESWDCAAWRRLGLTLSRCVSTSWQGEEDAGRLSSDVPSDRTRHNGHKLKGRNILLSIRKSFLLCGILRNGTGFSEWLWNLHPWRDPKCSCTMFLATYSSSAREIG